MNKLVISCILAVFALVATPKALRAAPLCPLGNATLHGIYAVSGSGSATDVGPAAGVGEVKFDGHGNSNATFTASFNGTIKTIPLTGTYTVNPDCTGTHVEGSSHYFFVVTPDGNKTSWIETDPGVVFSGTIYRLRPVESDDEARIHPTNRRTVPARLRSGAGANAARQPKAQLVTHRLSTAPKAP